MTLPVLQQHTSSLEQNSNFDQKYRSLLYTHTDKWYGMKIDLAKKMKIVFPGSMVFS